MEGFSIVISVSLFSLIIFFYLIIESIFIYHSRTTILQQLIFRFRLSKKIEKNIPNHWKLDEAGYFCSVNRPFLKYRLYCEFTLKDKYNTDIPSVREWVLIDRLGRIENMNDIINRLNSISVPDDIIKKYQREKLLNTLLNDLN